MTSLFPRHHSATNTLRQQLDRPDCLQVPGCYDALTARLLEQAGFRALFLGGFSVSAARLGLPDVGLLSFAEMLDQARSVIAATSLPVITDADTGYGNVINAQRTLQSCVQAGSACVMIEDQSWPKQCGHTTGKTTVDRTEAVARIRACVSAREELGLDVLIMARTDACAVDGFEEALWRVQAFAAEGADITFLEAPETLDQMEIYCNKVSGWKTANLVEDGRTPWLSHQQLNDLGYDVALYPVTLLLHTIHALRKAADEIGQDGKTARVSFDEARHLLGWPDYDARIEDLDS